MATASKRALRFVGQALAWLALVVGVFFVVGWIGSSIPRNGDWTEPADGVEIMVETNGIHTAIVMPTVTSAKDWRANFPVRDLGEPDRPYTHISVSWGEREVFLNTPGWSDLSPSTALNAATGGDGLLHVAHYVRPAPGENTRPVRLRSGEYTRLVRIIERQLAAGATRSAYPGYDDWDVFYDARGTYHVGNTCNQWTSDTLAEAGVKIGRWTPFAGGVMKWFPAPNAP
ncbi:MAG: DUF2459 domain-containing protein [Tsuneonella sp.]